MTGSFLLIFGSFISLNAQWARTYGGSVSEDVRSIQQTTDGGFIFAGQTSSFGAGSDDFWIMKFTSDGGVEWQKTYGGNVGDIAAWIQQTDDGGYIVAGKTSSFGTEAGDVWILKLSSDGDIEWQKTYGRDKSDSASSIQQTNDGGYVVVGHTQSFGAGREGNDIWIFKLSPAGNIEWQKAYGGDKNDSASFIQQRRDGGYIIVGHTESFGAGGADIWILRLSPGGNIEGQKTYGGSEEESANSFQQTSDGGYIVAGSTYIYGEWGAHSEGNIWILKLSSTGVVEWKCAYEGSGSYWASSIKQTSDGGYIVAGSTYINGEQGTGNIWILKLSPTGVMEWKRAYEGSGSYSASSIQQTIDGGYIVAGSASFGESARCDDSNSLILKLSSTGAIEWQKTYGGNYSEDRAFSFIQQASDEGYIVVGHTGSFGAGWADIWILKLLPNGDINPRCAFIKRSNAEVLDTDIMLEDIDITLEDTDITPEDTDITPQDTDITPQDSNASVCNLCSEKCSLTLSASSGGTTNPAPGTYTYATGTNVTLVADPSGDSSFEYWLGNIDCDRSSITITMDGDKSIRAYFYTPGPGGGGGIMSSLGLGGCFISTAAYGSSFHSHVRILRDFRDKYLMPGKIGRKIVDLYYKYSPFVADFVAKHKALKVAVRINLLPLIAISYSILRFGPTITTAMFIFIFILPVFFVWHHQRKLRRHIRGKKQND